MQLYSGPKNLKEVDHAHNRNALKSCLMHLLGQRISKGFPNFFVGPRKLNFCSIAALTKIE